MSFSFDIRPKSSRRFGSLLVSGALVASFAGLTWMSPASATHVDGVAYAGNEKCAEGLEEFKIDGGANGLNANDGVHEDPNNIGLVITITNASSQTFDWASTFDILAVLVKGSDGGLRYTYPGIGATGDTDLHALPLVEGVGVYHDISHVSFCFVVTQPPGPGITTLETPPPAEGQPAAEETVAVQPDAEAVVAGEVLVLGETLVQGDTLPRTGTPSRDLALFAAGLAGLGLGLLRLTRRSNASA